MKVTEVISNAQLVAGLQDFASAAIELNELSQTLRTFHNVLNTINNDSSINLWYERCNYQDIADANDTTKFPDRDGLVEPFNVSRSYPLPSDCRRVVRAIVDRATELRKVSYDEIVAGWRLPSVLLSIYAINKDEIHIMLPRTLEIVYAKKFPMYMPQDELTIPDEALEYLINQLAYNLALAYMPENAERCRLLATQSYNLLKKNVSTNQGLLYQSSYRTMNRMQRRGNLFV
jgi:hypothetical protein